MNWTFSVRVTDERGRPRRGARVTLMGDLFSGSMTEYTDRDGWAGFSIPSRTQSTWIVQEIYIDSNKVCGSRTLTTGDSLSFSV